MTVKQGDNAGAAAALLSEVFGVERAYEGKSTAGALERLEKSMMLSGGELALVWFARQLFNGEMQAHLADLDQHNRRLVVEVLAGFAGVDR